MKYVEDYENIPGKEWPVRPYYKRELAEAYAPHHFTGIRTQPLVQMDEAEFGTGRSPAAYRLQRLPENIHLPAGGTYIQVFRKTVKESIPHIARHGALVAVDFIPFQLDHPITTAATGTDSLIALLLHHQTEARGTQGLPDTYVDMSQYLGIGQEHALLARHGAAIVHLNELTLQAGHLKITVMKIHGINLLLLKPVVEAALPEGIALRIHSGIVYGIIERTVYGIHLEGKPTAVATEVVEEGDVVARAAEAGYMRTALLEVPVGGTLVHVCHAGDGLQLADLGRGHLLQLFKAYQCKLGQRKKVVLADAPAVAFHIKITLKFDRKQTLHPGSLVDALLTDEDQNLMIHHLGIEQRSNGGHQPLLEIDAEKLLVVLHMYAGSQTGNRVSSTVPSRQPLQIGYKGLKSGVYSESSTERMSAMRASIPALFMRLHNVLT